MSELKPCPFCGVAMKIARFNIGSPYYGAVGRHLLSCFFNTIPQAWVTHKKVLIAAWNRRAEQKGRE